MMNDFKEFLELPGTPQEQEWLKEQLETLSVRESYALAAVSMGYPPEKAADAIKSILSLRDLPADLLETFMVVGACLGRLEEQYLPDWAREKLEELRTPQQEQDTGPAMGGMNME